MGELKALGNDAAHVEAKAYNTIRIEEAEDSIKLAKEILKARYQLRGLVERLQDRKNKSNSLKDTWSCHKAVLRKIYQNDVRPTQAI